MRARRAIVLFVSGALLAGCDPTSPPSTATPVAPTDNGVSALPPEEVLLRATSALVGSRSFHVKGDFVRGGELLSIDVRIEGTNGRGTVVTTGVDGAPGWTIEILRVGDDGYVKVPASHLPEFAQGLMQHAPMPGAPALPAIDQLVAELTGRYVKIRSGNLTFGPLALVFDPVARQPIDPARQLLQVAGPVTKGATATVNGVPVIAITDQATADQCLEIGAQCGTIYVATTGEPYPIRIETGDGHTALDFADFGAPVDVVPPTPLDIFDATPYLQPH
jgi:hypothetical protein